MEKLHTKKFPTWYDWGQNFPNKSQAFSPCLFDFNAKTHCKESNLQCYNCVHTEIPEDIAQKLGIKPIREWQYMDFIIGLFIGTIVGVFAIALCNVGSRSDRNNGNKY